jgi:hypothetical protein
MRYRVRTPEGELDYASKRQLEEAYAQGLVGAEDEVLEEGHSQWRKASSLLTARAGAKGLPRQAQVLTVVLAVLLGGSALVMLMSDSWSARALALIPALALGVLLSRMNYTAFKRPGGPRG